MRLIRKLSRSTTFDARELGLTQGRDPFQRSLSFRLRELFGKRLKTHDVLLHHARDWRMQPGRGEPLDLIDEIRGGQLPGADLRKVRQTIDALQVRRRECVVKKVAVGIPSKGGMRLETDPRLDAESDSRSGRSPRPARPPARDSPRRRSNAAPAPRRPRAAPADRAAAGNDTAAAAHRSAPKRRTRWRCRNARGRDAWGALRMSCRSCCCPRPRPDRDRSRANRHRRPAVGSKDRLSRFACSICEYSKVFGDGSVEEKASTAAPDS